ncbi:MAG TPA: hypothetical protein VIE65_19925 [Methylobacter sp.]|jgi:glucose uptake protein GlcU
MQEQLDPELWKFGLTMIAAIMGLIIVSGAVVAGIYFKSHPEQATKSTNQFLESQSAIRLLTVIVVVIAACALSVLHVLTDGAIAILSGITGYVLGGLPANSKSEENVNKKDTTRLE